MLCAAGSFCASDSLLVTSPTYHRSKGALELGYSTRDLDQFDSDPFANRRVDILHAQESDDGVAATSARLHASAPGTHRANRGGLREDRVRKAIGVGPVAAHNYRMQRTRQK